MSISSPNVSISQPAGALGVNTVLVRWTTTGTVATCTFSVQGDDGSGAFATTVIGATTCTASGQTAATATSSAFLRVNVSALTGGGTFSPAMFLYDITGAGGSTNISQVGGSTTVTGGLPGLLAVAGPSASGAAVSGNPVRIGANNQGNTKDLSADGNGSLVIGILSGVAVGGATGTMALDTAAGTPGVLDVIPFMTTGSVMNPANAFEQVAIQNGVGAATTQIIALAAGQAIKIGSVVVSNANATATTWKLVQGTGANCATGQTDLTALIAMPANTTNNTVSIRWAGQGLTAITGNAVCVTGSAAGSLSTTALFSRY